MLAYKFCKSINLVFIHILNIMLTSLEFYKHLVKEGVQLAPQDGTCGSISNSKQRINGRGRKYYTFQVSQEPKPGMWKHKDNLQCHIKRSQISKLARLSIVASLRHI